MDVTSALPQATRRVDLPLARSIGLHAVRLIEWAREAGPAGLIHVAEDERRAEQLAQALRGLAPDLEVLLLPPWDCLPYDSASPSREVMGRRASTLRRMAEKGRAPRLLIASAAAIVQRVPPRETWKDAVHGLAAGEAFSPGELEAYLRRTGYVLDERVDEPGEAAIRGQVLDLFPANSPSPYRAEHDGESILSIRRYDPVSQRTETEVETLALEPASEIVLNAAPEGEEPPERAPGMEHRLPEFYSRLDTVFDYWPDAALVIDARAEERREIAMGQVADAHESRVRLRTASGGASAVFPERLFIGDDEWRGVLARRRLTAIRSPSREDAEAGTVPRFAGLAKPARALAEFAQAQTKAGRKLVLAAATKQDLGRMRRRVQSLQATPEPVKGWDEVLEGKRGAWFMLQAELRSGFIDERDGIAVIAAADLLGSRVGSEAARESQSASLPFLETGFRIGDAVIHLDHGVGILQGIETLAIAGADAGDAIRLGYADDSKLMLPVTEIGQVWRYGASTEALSLDKLNGGSWPARRARIEAELQETAKRLTQLVEARRSRRLKPIVPPSGPYERFVARFPFL
jgi:transcription-repair coupling factor (superfamily II helicase)